MQSGRSPASVWPASVVSVGAGLMVASLWLQRVTPQSFEDFYSIYGGRLGIPDSIPPNAYLDPLPGWFFPLAAAGQVLFAALAWRIAILARLRPDLAAADDGFTAKAVACALALLLWTLGAVVLYPGVVDPWVDQAGPFSRLTGTWIALAAAVMTALGLFAIAVNNRRARTDGSRRGRSPHVLPRV
jgi:hypothetical protein